MNAYPGVLRLLPAFFLFWAAFAACGEDVIIRVPPPEIQTDELAQQPAALVDILWVVDNSGTMVDEQAALATNFQRFITGLTVCQGTGQANDVCDFNTKVCSVSGAPCNPPDYHIGVVTTDVRASAALDQGRLRRAGLCTASPGSAPANGKFRYCQAASDCVHQAEDPESDPANTQCDQGQAISYITATTPGASSAFSRIVRVGTEGGAGERGIEAAARALGRHVERTVQTGAFLPAPAENAGFVRPEASLFVIFVSDEDDGTFGLPQYYYRVFESLKRAGNEGMVSLSAIVGDPDLDGTGPNPGGCAQTVNNPNQVRTAQEGTRYIALSMYSRGLSEEFKICDEQRLTCPTGSTCSYPIAGLPGICLSTTCQGDQECGNFKCGEQGCISCQAGACATDAGRFAELLQKNGIFGSICAEDYGVVLDALGFEAAGLKRKFELTKFPDCALGNSNPIPCFPGDTPPDGANPPTAPFCVKVNGEVIPNDRATGWVYESGSNAVFFDGSFVPPTDATVEVSYRLSTADKPLSCSEILN